MIRRLVLALIALAPAVGFASASGSYSPGSGCPSPTCEDLLDVRLNAPRGVGAIFVAIVPIRDGAPSLPGGWFTGPNSVSIGGSPLAFRSGEIGPIQQRFRIPGGVCDLAAKQGVPTGMFAAYAGYGLAPDDLVQSIARVEERVAAADPEAQGRAREAIERLRAINPLATAAAEDMLTQKTFWPIATISCGGR